MALFLQELFIVAADLMFASVLSCLFYAAGCLVVPGLLAYVLVLSYGPGVKRKAKRNICQMKETAGKILDSVGLRGISLGPTECPSDLQGKPSPAGERERWKVVESLTGSHLSPTGIPSGMKTPSSMIWVEEIEESKVPGKLKEIPVFLLSLLFAPADWCLEKRHIRRLASLLAPVKNPRG